MDLSSTLKTEAVCTSRMSLNYSQTLQRHITPDYNAYSDLHAKLQFCTVSLHQFNSLKLTYSWLRLTYIFIYLLTPCCRVLLEKLTGLQLIKKFLVFYGTRRFITAFKSATSPYPEPARSSPYHRIPLPEDPS